MNAIAQIAPKPETQELVTNEILRYVALNPQAFSGAQNPSTIYELMVYGSPLIFRYYREVREKDTAIISSLETRRIMAMARNARVVSAQPDQKTGPAAMLADKLNDFLEGLRGFRQARREMLGCPGYGYTVMEVLWNVDSGRVMVDKIVGRPQELFRFGQVLMPQTGPLLLAQYPGGEGSPVPPNKFLVSSYDEENGDHRGQPLLRRLYWPSWFKRNVLKLHLNFLEKGPGTVGVKYPSGAGADDKAKALEAAKAIATELAVAVPETFNIIPEIITSSRVRSGDDFRLLFDYLDAEMTRIVLGQTLTTRGAENGRGTQALGSIHQDVMFELVRSDLADHEDVINEQLCAPWLLWNFGPQALDPKVRPYWRAEKEPPKDAAAALDQLTKAHALGARIAEKSVYTAGEIEEPEDGEKLLPAATQPMDIFGKPGAGDPAASSQEDGSAR